jgi:hypothetical protein
MALIGVLSTVVVAIGGYVFNYLAGERDREASRQLADDAHKHERALAETAQAHQRQLRQGERAYEDRKATYRQVATWALCRRSKSRQLNPCCGLTVRLRRPMISRTRSGRGEVTRAYERLTAVMRDELANL